MNTGLIVSNIQNFFNISTYFRKLNDIKASKLFQITQKMPLGGISHTHKHDLCSSNYLVSLTYLTLIKQI